MNALQQLVHGLDAHALSDARRRELLVKATTITGGIGVLAAAYPFAASFAPSERAKAEGGPVDADISGLKPGQLLTVAWRGKPVWLMRRTDEMVRSLEQNNPLLADPMSKRSEQPANCANPTRSIRPDIFCAVGICTHLGCSPGDRFTPGAQPSLPDDWPGGFLCPCHGSTFDLAGRVFKNKPAPDNLPVPPHKYLSDTVVMIGDDTKA